MRVFINGRFLSQPVTGVQRFAREIINILDNYLENEDIKFEILVPSNVKTEVKYKNIKITKVGKLRGHIWEQLELAYFSRKGLLINLCNTGPLAMKNQITVIHDVAVYSNSNNYSFVFKLWYRILLRFQGRFAKKIVTVSEFSKSEIIRYLRVKDENIEVIYEGKEHFINKPSDNSIIKKNNLTRRPYLLAVSSLNPNKNFKLIIESLRYLENVDIDIVIAGGTDPRVFNLKEVTIPSSVKYLGYVSDSELKALYENAFCFIFPSYYEGFGLPPLEAMSLGCPVIMSNRASLSEVGGEAALYCDPDNPEYLSLQIIKLINNPSLRKRMIKDGIKQAEKFTWTRSALQLLNIIRKAE